MILGFDLNPALHRLLDLASCDSSFVACIIGTNSSGSRRSFINMPFWFGIYRGGEGGECSHGMLICSPIAVLLTPLFTFNGNVGQCFPEACLVLLLLFIKKF